MDKSGRTIYFGEEQQKRYMALQEIVAKANKRMDELFNTSVMNADFKNHIEALNDSMVEIFEFHPRWVEGTQMMEFKNPLELSTQFSLIENRVGYAFIRYTISRITAKPTLNQFVLLNDVRETLETLEQTLSEELAIIVHVDPAEVVSVPKRNYLI